MGGRSLFSITVLLVGLFLAIAVGLGTAGNTADSNPVPQQNQVTGNEGTREQVVHLYFGDASGRHLTAEQRVLTPAGDDVTFSRDLIRALIEGPQRKGTRTLPKGAALRAVYLLDNGSASNGTAVVDFDAQSFGNHPGGVEAEMLSIFSIVNTLAINVDSIKQVMILIGGGEAATLAGHVDISRPFRADMMWVR